MSSAMPLAPKPGFVKVRTSSNGTTLQFVRDYSNDVAINALLKRKHPGGKGEHSFPARDIGVGRRDYLETQLQLEKLLGTPEGDGIEALITEMANAIRI